jgi:hypothetical protein
LFLVLLIRPFIPDMDSIVYKIFYIRISSEEPKKLMNNSFEKNFLGGKEGESF